LRIRTSFAGTKPDLIADSVVARFGHFSADGHGAGLADFEMIG
jgi:hypothetical protein